MTLLVADAICFDVAYDDGIYGQVARGAELLTVQTSNAIFIHTAQIDQQFEISRLRALETGRWVVVAAINGVSGDRRARRQRRGERGAAARRTCWSETCGLARGLTPAVRLGAWPGRARGRDHSSCARWRSAWFRIVVAARARPRATDRQGTSP